VILFGHPFHRKKSMQKHSTDWFRSDEPNLQ
jgi:hypothetical protein